MLALSADSADGWADALLLATGTASVAGGVTAATGAFSGAGLAAGCATGGVIGGVDGSGTGITGAAAVLAVGAGGIANELRETAWSCHQK